MNARPTLLPDRLIWFSLLAALVVALVAGQARANLHAAARATVFDGVSAEHLAQDSWCRMALDTLGGEAAVEWPHPGDAAAGPGIRETAQAAPGRDVADAPR